MKQQRPSPLDGTAGKPSRESGKLPSPVQARSERDAGGDGKWVGQISAGYREDNGKPIRKYFYGDTREEVAHQVALALATSPNKGAAVPQELI